MRITIHVKDLDEAEAARERFASLPDDVEVIVNQPVAVSPKPAERQPLKTPSR